MPPALLQEKGVLLFMVLPTFADCRFLMYRLILKRYTEKFLSFTKSLRKAGVGANSHVMVTLDICQVVHWYWRHWNQRIAPPCFEHFSTVDQA